MRWTSLLFGGLNFGVRNLCMFRQRCGLGLTTVMALLLIPSSLQAACPPDAISVPVGSDIQAMAKNASEGKSFCILQGVHRMQRIVPKRGQKFIGEKGAVLNGSIILKDFRREGRYWVVSTDAPMAKSRGDCLQTRPYCYRSNRIYFSNRLFEPTLSLEAVVPGSFFFDGTRIYLVDDPSSALVELTIVAHAFWNHDAADVEIRNLTIEKYATRSQDPAIFSGENFKVANWIIEDNEVRYNSAVGIAAGRGCRVARNNVHHNGQLGISLNGDDTIIENNTISHNNTHGYNASWEGGGLKATVVSRIAIRNNHVFENNGTGLWCDENCQSITFEGNTVEKNADAGIFFEISDTAVISGNTVRYNGTGAGGQQGKHWFWGAEILIAGSKNVVVTGNKVRVSEQGSGIMLIDQGREQKGNKSFYETVRNSVHHNEIIYDGDGESGAASDVETGHLQERIIETGNNIFDHNTYVFPDDQIDNRFIWGHKEMGFAEFQSLGQEKSGAIAEHSNDMTNR